MIRLAYIQTYKTIVKELALQFSIHYFDSRDVEILGDENVGIGPIDCNQYVFTIDNVICALHNNIPRRVLIDWYDTECVSWVNHPSIPAREKAKINLYHYRLKNKGPNEND